MHFECDFSLSWVQTLRSPWAHLHVVGMLHFMSDINQLSLPTPFLFCSCVCFSLYGSFNCISIHKFSRQLSAFSLCSSSLISALLVLPSMYHYSSGLISVLLVLSTIYPFMKVSFNPDIIPRD